MSTFNPIQIDFLGESLLVHPETDVKFFRDLDAIDKAEFIDWAKQNPLRVIKSTFHPYVQDTLYRLQGYKP